MKKNAVAYNQLLIISTSCLGYKDGLNAFVILFKSTKTDEDMVKKAVLFKLLETKQ